MSRWKTPHDWLLQKIAQEDIKWHRAAFMAYVIEVSDNDTIQDVFEKEMDNDGYFDKADPTEAKIRGRWVKLDHFYSDDACWEYLVVVILNEGFDGLRIGVGLDEKNLSLVGDTICENASNVIGDRFIDAEDEGGRGFHHFDFVKEWR